MAIIVTPVAGFTTWDGIRHIAHGIVDDTVVTVHIHQEFVACIGIGHIGGVGDASTCVHAILSDALRPFLTRGTTLTVYHHIVGTTQQHFCLAVAIPVVGDDIQLMTTTADHIGTNVYPPQQCTIQLIRINAVVGSVGAAYVVSSVIQRTSSLEDDFHLTVTVEVGNLGIVGNISVGDVFP